MLVRHGGIRMKALEQREPYKQRHGETKMLGTIEKWQLSDISKPGEGFWPEREGGRRRSWDRLCLCAEGLDFIS